MNYLQLVNRTIFEAGVELDELTSGNFASPSDPMYRRFKNYVRDAWFELQMSRNEWEFKVKQAMVEIRPRVLVTNGNRTLAPPVDSVYEGDTSENLFTVKAVTLLSGAWAAGTAQAYLDLDDLSANQWTFGETFDEVDPDPANVNVFKLKWYGQYDLVEDITDAFEINKSSFYIQNVDGTNRRRLQWVSWETFQQMANASGSGFFGEPTFITETQEGKWDVFPRPAIQQRIWFDYTAVPQELSAATDTPLLPTEYHEIIIWQALMNYGDYDEKPQVFQRAERRMKRYQNVLEFNKLPTLSFGVNIYDATSF